MNRDRMGTTFRSLLVIVCTVLAASDTLAYISSSWQESTSAQSQASKIPPRPAGFSCFSYCSLSRPLVGSNSGRRYLAWSRKIAFLYLYSYKRPGCDMAVLRRTGRLPAGSFHSGVVSHLGRLSRVVGGCCLIPFSVPALLWVRTRPGITFLI